METPPPAPVERPAPPVQRPVETPPPAPPETAPQAAPPPAPAPTQEGRPPRRTNDPNRFVWVPGDLTPVPAPATPEATPTPAPQPAAAPAAIETLAADTVREILVHMGYRARVTGRQSPAEEGDDGPAYLVDVRGVDSNALVGRQGEPLDALQYLTRLIVQHKTGHWASIVVDIEGYREKRAQSLRHMAEQMAERVKRDGRSIALDPMPPYERRIIHLALRNHPAVMTVSVGEGDARKVTIRPKK